MQVVQTDFLVVMELVIVQVVAVVVADNDSLPPLLQAVTVVTVLADG
jgi:hypothetical protein